MGIVKKYDLRNNGRYVDHQYHRNKCIAFLWPWVQAIDILLLIGPRILARIRRTPLVLDRFVQDILVDVMAEVNDPNLHRRLVGKMMLGLVPRGAITFLFDVDELTALQRKTDIPNFEY